MNGQAQRILDYLWCNKDQDVSALVLHRIGSGMGIAGNGFCASLSRRISDLRAQGHNVTVSRSEVVNGQRRTWYRLNSKTAANQTQQNDNSSECKTV